MYARVEVYPVMDQLHVGAVILVPSENPNGTVYDPVWACRLEVPVSATGEPVDDLWTALVALNEQLEANVAALH